jgi:hypothetical protein
MNKQTDRDRRKGCRPTKSEEKWDWERERKNYTGEEKEDEKHEQTDRQRYLEERQTRKTKSEEKWDWKTERKKERR